MNNELHVIFGTGPLGKWTMRTLIGLGKRVRLVNRSGKAEGIPAGVELVAGDAYDVASTTRLTQGATSVYQCAQPAYHQWAGNFPRLQDAILAGAAANGAKLIVAENLYMYGEPQGQPLSESTPYAAHTHKGRLRQAMTESLFAAHQRGEVRVASARGSDFFGPDEPIQGEMVFRAALAGKRVTMLGRLDMPHTFTYVADFGRTLAILGTNDTGLGRAWHVPSAPPVPQSELVRLLQAAVGQPVKVMAASPLMVRLLGLFNPTIREMNEMMYEWMQPFVMDSSAFTKAFGLTATPLPQAVQETVAWARGQIARLQSAS
ncbi:MAG: NAD-dependent epimerase/dehydratase family protein [Chloroflexaceae bacterium]|jgi:nucleoside-diphosphate-sugar epimerase|nr:NAD-dependent epimerase/dehydratase family protein [Chloroflexaceae bacterium]